MTDMNKLMKQAQKLQEAMKKEQNDIINTEVTGEAGGGLVKITMRGDHKTVRVFIDESLLKPTEKDILQDLVAAASNHTVQQIAKMTESRMRTLTNNLGLPSGFGGEGTE